MDGKFEKLRQLILHESTPVGERAAALDRMIANVEKGGGPISRSVRIGRSRRRSVVDEWARLEPFVKGRSYGEAIASIYQSCQACRVFPSSIDFGFHGSGEAVVAVNFSSGHLPNGLDLQDALRLDWPKARVSTTTDQGILERTYLFYLGVFEEEVGKRP